MKKYIISFVLLFAGLTSLRLESYQVAVRTLEGTVIVVEIEPNETIRDLKRKIFVRTNIAPDLQRMIIGGREWGDGSPASAWAPVAQEGWINLVRRRNPNVVLPVITEEERRRIREQREHEEQEAAQQEQQEAAQRERKKILHSRYKKGGLTIAALAATLGAYTTWRSYQKRKSYLVKKYKLGNFTKLQKAVWLATALAKYGISDALRAILFLNPKASLTDFTGSDPLALVELYFGHVPSSSKLNRFLQKYFPQKK